MVCVCLLALRNKEKILEVHWPAGLAHQLEILSQKLRWRAIERRHQTLISGFQRSTHTHANLRIHMCGTCTYPPHISNSRKRNGGGGRLQYKAKKNYHKNIHCPKNKPRDILFTTATKKKIGYLTIEQTKKSSKRSLQCKLSET